MAYDIANNLPGGVASIIYMIKMDSGINSHYYFTTPKPLIPENPEGFYYFVSPTKCTSVIKYGLITKIHDKISYDCIVYLRTYMYDMIHPEPIFTFYLPA